MISRKYAGDWRLENRVDARGRVKTETVYAGGDWRFTDPRARQTAFRRLLAALTLALWCALIAPLVPRSLSARQMWVLLPYVAAIAGAMPLTAAVWRLLHAREPLRHEQADRISLRYPIGALLCTALPAVSFAGALAGLVRQDGAPLPGDWLFLCCSAAATGLGAALFAFRGRLKTAKCDGGET